MCEECVIRGFAVEQSKSRRFRRHDGILGGGFLIPWAGREYFSIAWLDVDDVGRYQNRSMFLESWIWSRCPQQVGRLTGWLAAVVVLVFQLCGVDPPGVGGLLAIGVVAAFLFAIGPDCFGMGIFRDVRQGQRIVRLARLWSIHEVFCTVRSMYFRLIVRYPSCM